MSYDTTGPHMHICEHWRRQLWGTRARAPPRLPAV